MLQRAASNACTWWWASHLRTKQSKWLEQNLQDMEEKVNYMLNLIQEDGDSFARRAEMYYRKRPELINFVEESYKSYRALADRYDHISGELQNANNTIANVFPEQFQFAIDDDEDDDSSPRKHIPPTNENKIPKVLPKPPKLNIPKIQSFRKKDAKDQSKLPTKKVQLKRSTSSTSKSTTTSKMSSAVALQEIDKLQKGILALQTEKEFVRSSFEGGVAKYWEIEKQISEMQEEVCTLQDEFGVATVIDDDEARTLMAATALKSCQETLMQLQGKQEQSAKDAKVEYQRIEDAHEKLHTIKNELISDQMDQSDLPDEKEAVKSSSGLYNLEQKVNLEHERLQSESIQEKIREHFDMNSDTFLTVTELAEKIDELVHKVINLETAVSSQTALIKRLRSETDELQENLSNLDEEKTTAVTGSDKLTDELRKMDEKLSGIQDLHQSVEDQNNNLQTHFTETRCNLNYLSEKLHSVKHDEEIDTPGSPLADLGIFGEAQKQKDDILKVGFEGNHKPNDLSKKSDESIVSAEFQRIGNQDYFGKELHSKKEDLFPIEDADIIKVDPQEKSSFNDFSAKPHFVKSNGNVETYGSIKDNTEKQELSQTEEDSLYLASQENFNLNYFSEKVHFVKPEGKEEILASFQDNVEKKDSLESEENILTSDSQGNCDPSHLSQELHFVEEEVQSPNLSAQNEDGIPSKLSNTSDDISESCEPLGQLDKVVKHNTFATQNNMPNENSEQKAIEKEEEDEPNWQKLFLSGLEDREKVLLGEYTAVLRNYKTAKKKLSEIEKKNQDNTSGTIVQLRELKCANAIKDDEIRSLRQKLSFLQTSFEGNLEATDTHLKNKQGNQHPVINLLDDQSIDVAVTNDNTITNVATETNPLREEEEIKVIHVDEAQAVSSIEEKLRRDIDELLEENLEFWLRFSTLIHQIQKFQSSIQDLQVEISKLKDSKKQEGNTPTHRSPKSDARPIYKHLSEIQTELTVWLENYALLKEELQHRFSSLCEIQEEISRVSNTGSDTEEVEFTSYQAAKYQGEVLNMQQENNKVADELQAGVDHVRGLQDEIEKTLSKLNEDFKLSGLKNQNHPHQVKHAGSRSKVPLRSFIFGVKSKKQKPSFFRCINPTLQKQHSDLTAEFPP